MMREEYKVNKKGAVCWDIKDCIYCHNCIESCEPKALKVDVVSMECQTSKCNLCGECERVCETNSIWIKWLQ